MSSPAPDTSSIINGLIDALSESDLVAECPYCSETFQARDALLFDGRTAAAGYPRRAEGSMRQLDKHLRELNREIGQQKRVDTTRSTTMALAAGIGKSVEKLLPAFRHFDLVPADCRFLAEPIDMIEFRGMTERGSIDHITFLDVKTGGGALNEHQRQIRDAVREHRVRWRQYE